MVDLPLPTRKSDKNLSSERRSTVIGLDKEQFMTPRKPVDFKEQYFFLFDDFLLQVVKKPKVLALRPSLRRDL
jgi:hypothetical protein